MKLKMIASIMLVAILAGTVLIWKSTDQLRAKTMGGTMKVEIDEGQKFVNVTWKENDLWILTRPIEEHESYETKPYIFQQKTSFGIREGKVEIYEVQLD